MNHTVVIETLDRKSHNREEFDCGVEVLNQYLRERAGQDQERGINKVYVATLPDSYAVIGYYTLSAYSIALDSLPKEITRKLPVYKVVPAALLGRLAVDIRFQKQGIGKTLLANAFAKIFSLRNDLGMYALVVDAKNTQTAHFYMSFGFEKFKDKEDRLFLVIEKMKKYIV